jgi:uncharacterized membrane protein
MVSKVRITADGLKGIAALAAMIGNSSGSAALSFTSAAQNGVPHVVEPSVTAPNKLLGTSYE